MTWVIGMRGLLSRAIVLSDTRVTVADQEGNWCGEFDGVQKLHKIHDNIVMGFAGNIDTGLRMVSDMAVMARNSIPDGYMTDEPSRLLLRWARRARYHWAKSLTDRDRAGGCALLFAAARPQTSGPVVITPNVVYTLEAPDFRPELAPWLRAVAIGGGSLVGEYAEELEKISQEKNNLLAFDNAAWDPMGGPLVVLAAVLAQRIRAVGASGVSPHLLLCSVQWGRVAFATNEGVGFEQAHRDAPWPRIARDLDEWRQMKKAHGLANALATA